MLINLRNALMAGKRLPYDAEVEYLQSSGTQWIDTGIRGAGSGYLATTFQPLNVGSSSTYWRYFGASNGDTRTERTIAYNAGGRTIFENGYNQFVLGTSRGDVYTIQKTGYNVPSGSAVGDKNFQIFGYNGTYNIGNVRFYSFSLWDSNNTLVRDFIPVRKGTVGYLYDRVSGKLFGNAGTGDFVLGPDVVPVEYIESHGTEWIDTGVNIASSDDARFVTTCTITNTVANYSSTWVGSGVLSTGGLHYVLDHNGIRTGGGDASMAIPYNRGDVVTIDVYYDSQHRRTCKIGQSIYQGTAYSASTAKLAILNYPAPTDVTSHPRQAGKLFHVEVYKSSALVRRYYPVRVGTEGAMMDVLTRRIYRNAGTGAFTYGNDLKYPIPAA